MIYSPSKAKDVRWRLSLLTQMGQAIKDNLPITAKELGSMTALLAKRISTHDYSAEDRRDARLSKVMKSVAVPAPIEKPSTEHRTLEGIAGLRVGTVALALKEIERIFL